MVLGMDNLDVLTPAVPFPSAVEIKDKVCRNKVRTDGHQEEKNGTSGNLVWKYEHISNGMQKFFCQTWSKFGNLSPRAADLRRCHLNLYWAEHKTKFSVWKTEQHSFLLTLRDNKRGSPGKQSETQQANAEKCPQLTSNSQSSSFLWTLNSTDSNAPVREKAGPELSLLGKRR